MTLEEIYLLLNKKYSKVLINPNLLITIKKYRPVRIFIKGEVKRPGLYNLLGTSEGTSLELSDKSLLYDDSVSVTDMSEILPKEIQSFAKNDFPSLYSAIKVANGITPYSDLSKVKNY